MKGEQRRREQGLQVKRCLWAGQLAIVWTCLKAWEEVQGWTDNAEEEGVTGRTRGVFQSCVFNLDRFCTGDRGEKGLEIPIAMVF